MDHEMMGHDAGTADPTGMMDHSNHQTPTVWPSPTHRISMTALFLLLLIVTAWAAGYRLSRLQGRILRQPATMLLAMGVLLSTLMFQFIANMLVSAIGTSLSPASCSAANLVCIIFYCIAKVLIFFFLLERVFLVHIPVRQSTSFFGERMRSKWWMYGALSTTLWAVAPVFMIIQRVADIREHDGACQIGLKMESEIYIMVLDSVENCFLTVAFALPLMRSQFGASRSLAIRSCIAAVVALTTSLANVATLTALHKELAWVCLLCCSVDLTINALICLWATSGSFYRDENALAAASFGTGSMPKSAHCVCGGAAARSKSGQRHRGLVQLGARPAWRTEPSSSYSPTDCSRPASGVFVVTESITCEEDGEEWKASPRRPYRPPNRRTPSSAPLFRETTAEEEEKGLSSPALSDGSTDSGRSDDNMMPLDSSS